MSARCRLIVVDRAMRMRETSEVYRRLIRTRLGARVADLVRKTARTTAADPIGVEAIIGGGGDQGAVAINIDVA